MSSESRDKWDGIYRSRKTGLPAAARVLAENSHLLPAQGRALDVACGRGGNALLLARQGLTVTAQDISQVAIDQLAALARDEGLALRAEARDLLASPPVPDSFDVIVISHYLERPLLPKLLAALKPGGLFFYQTFTRDRLTGSGPSNDEYRLKQNELLEIFAGHIVRVYREEGLTGDTGQGMRDLAMIVAQRRE